MLQDITKFGLEKAFSEFNDLGRARFLDKYGFKESTCLINHNGREYDAKAICGAAHAFDFPEFGSLEPTEFPGGNAAIARVLAGLGYDVKRRRAAPKAWTEEERVLALDLYLRFGHVADHHPSVIELSKELNLRKFHPDAGTRENFRSPSAVALKLANFAAIDPSYPGKGMKDHSAGDEDTWDSYAGDTELLAAVVADIRTTSRVVPLVGGVSVPVSRPLEQRHREHYQINYPVGSVQAERREAELVERFANWLRHQNLVVSARHYDKVNPPLRSDLADETRHRLWEAKSDVSRSSVRMALGQLFDYLRFESGNWTGGVLLPHTPSEDLISLITSCERAIAWPSTREGFRIVEPSRPR